MSSRQFLTTMNSSSKPERREPIPWSTSDSAPEFPSLVTVPLFMIVTLLAITAYRKNIKGQRKISF